MPSRASRREDRINRSGQVHAATTSMPRRHAGAGRRGAIMWENGRAQPKAIASRRSDEHTSELQSLMRNSYAVFCLKTQNQKLQHSLSHNQRTLTSQII